MAPRIPSSGPPRPPSATPAGRPAPQPAAPEAGGAAARADEIRSKLEAAGLSGPKPAGLPPGVESKLDGLDGRSGVVRLLGGAPGTGETAARYVAARRGTTLRVITPELAREFIGETEKNLRALPDGAEGAPAVLFFDEADALFGKRTGVADGQDRYANQETGYLLERLERYDGLVLVATNRKGASDDAFVDLGA
jgi:hypothetical protein